MSQFICSDSQPFFSVNDISIMAVDQDEVTSTSFVLQCKK